MSKQDNLAKALKDAIKMIKGMAKHRLEVAEAIGYTPLPELGITEKRVIKKLEKILEDNKCDEQ